MRCRLRGAQVCAASHSARCLDIRFGNSAPAGCAATLGSASGCWFASVATAISAMSASDGRSTSTASKASAAAVSPEGMASFGPGSASARTLVGAWDGPASSVYDCADADAPAQ